MALSIKDPKADRLAREVARRTGDTITGAIVRSLEERLAKIGKPKSNEKLLADLNEISRRCAALPDIDTRTPDEILGYDENGLPT
jgi:antitoxin VapB